MEAVLCMGPYDAEQAAGVKFAQVYRCFVPVQETQSGRRAPHLAAVTRGDASRHKGKDDLPGGTRDVHNKAPMQKSASGKCPAGAGAYEYEEATSPDCLAASSRKDFSPRATCAPDRRVENRRPAGPRKEAVAAATAPTTVVEVAPATAARKVTPSAPVDGSRGRGASGARCPCQHGRHRTASRARPTPGGSD